MEGDKKPFSELMGDAIDEHLEKDKDKGDDPENKETPKEDRKDGQEGDETDGEGGEYYPEADEPDSDEPKGEDAKKADEDGEQGSDKDPDFKEPEGLSEDASARFQKLAGNNKELSAQVAEITEKFTQLEDFVNSSNATAEEFTQLIEVSRLAKSPNISDRQQAYTMGLQFIEQLAPTIGLSTGQDPLGEFPDLKTALENMEITKDAAVEIANGRRFKTAQQLNEQINQQQQGAYQQQNRIAVEAAQAQNDLGGMFQEFQKDPGWKSKEPLVEEYAKGLTQQVLAGQIAPSAVPLLMKRQYDSIGAVMEQMTAEKRRKEAENNPMRPNGVSNPGAEREPKNFQDGMMMAIERIQGQ